MHSQSDKVYEQHCWVILKAEQLVFLKERKRHWFIRTTHLNKLLFAALERQCLKVTAGFLWLNTIQISIQVCKREKIKSRSCLFRFYSFFQTQINHTWPMGSPVLRAASVQKMKTSLTDSATQINTKQVPLYGNAVGLIPQRLFWDV